MHKSHPGDRDQISKQKEEIQSLQTDLKTLGKVAGDAQSTLNCVQDVMLGFSESVAQLYHHVMMTQGKTPDR